MSQLRRIADTVRDGSGRARAGAQVTVRRLGATVITVNSPNDFIVVDPGSIVATDSVRVGTGSVSRTVTATIGGNEIQVGGPGLVGVNPGDRLTVTNTPPTIYSDEGGNLVASNPLTCDKDGNFSFYVAEPVDILITDSGSDIALFPDFQSSPEYFDSWMPNLAAGTGWFFRLRNTIGNAATKVWRMQMPAGTDKFYLRADGGFVAAGDCTISGNLTVSGTFTPAGNLNIAGTITGGGALTITAGGAAITGNSTITGNLNVSGSLIIGTSINCVSLLTTTVAASLDIQGRRYKATGTALVAGDVALSGFGASPTVTITAGSNDTRGQIKITTNTDKAAGTSGTATLTFKDGTFTNAPIVIAQLEASDDADWPNTAGFGAGSSLAEWQVKVTSISATQVVFTFYNAGGPTFSNGKFIQFNFICIG